MMAYRFRLRASAAYGGALRGHAPYPRKSPGDANRDVGDKITAQWQSRWRRSAHGPTGEGGRGRGRV